MTHTERDATGEGEAAMAKSRRSCEDMRRGEPGQ